MHVTGSTSVRLLYFAAGSRYRLIAARRRCTVYRPEKGGRALYAGERRGTQNHGYFISTERDSFYCGRSAGQRNDDK